MTGFGEFSPRLKPSYQKGDRDAAVGHLESHLASLGSLIEDFSASVDLMEHAACLCRQVDHEYQNVMKRLEQPEFAARPQPGRLSAILAKQRTPTRWRFIAAMHAAVSVAQVWDSLNAIIQAAGKTASLKPDVNFKALEEAKDQLNRKLPDWAEVRNGSVHSVDKSYTLEKIERNSIGGLYINSTLVDDTLVHSIDGKVVKLLVNRETLQALIDVRNLVYSAFEKVSH